MAGWPTGWATTRRAGWAGSASTRSATSTRSAPSSCRACCCCSSSPFVFGWAKPVPVAFHRLRNPKRDMVWVALAGPGINIVLAIGRGAADASAAAS